MERFGCAIPCPTGDDRWSVGGVYERIDPPSEIVQTWVWEAPDPLAGIPMRVRFRFLVRDASTDVVITHEGLPTDAACTVHEGGWEAALESLDRYSRSTPTARRGPAE